MKKIAFVCVHNSCRSIIAEGWAKHLGKDLLDVYSAGTVYNEHPKPLAIEVMKDLNIDMSHAKSKLVSSLPPDLDILVTMGCNVACPLVFAKHKEDWGLDDPSGLPKEAFEKTRDLIKIKVLDIIERIKKGEL